MILLDSELVSWVVQLHAYYNSLIYWQMQLKGIVVFLLCYYDLLLFVYILRQFLSTIWNASEPKTTSTLGGITKFVSYAQRIIFFVIYVSFFQINWLRTWGVGNEQISAKYSYIQPDVLSS